MNVAGGAPPTPRPWAVGLATAVLMMALGSLWAIATPPFAAPDEPSHAVRAVATWTGDASGRAVRVDGGEAGTVTVKRYEVESPYDKALAIARCNAFEPDQPACGPTFDPTGGSVEVESSAGFYPPLFYVAVGWPAAVSDGATSLYLMRLAHVALCAAFVGLAGWALARRARPQVALGGLLLAVTPMVGFLAGTVNSSGLEIAASIALWASLVALLDPLPRSGRYRWPEAAAVVVSGLVLCFTRTFSPGYAAVVCGLALVAAPAMTPRVLLRRRDVLAALSVLAIGAAVATLLIVRSGQFDTPATSGSPLPAGETPLSFGLGYQETGFRQMIGVFGWLDTGTAQLSYYCWIVACGALVMGAAVLGAWRRTLGVVLTLVATVALPIAANWGQADTAGFVWQGRYSLPLAVGLPLLAAVAWDESDAVALPVRRRTVLLLAALAVVGQCYGLYWALRRAAVGLDGELVFFGDADWSPPLLGTWGTALAAVVLAALTVAAVAVATRDAGRTTSDPPVPPAPQAPQAPDDASAGPRADAPTARPIATVPAPGAARGTAP